MVRKSFVSLLACLALGSGSMAAHAAAEKDVSLVYDIFLGGVPLAELTFNAKISEGAYDAQSRLRTSGPLSVFYKAEFDANTAGRRAPDGVLTPDKFQAFSKARSKVQNVEVSYTAGTPATVAAEPAFIPKPYQIEPTEQTGAFDPLTGAIMALVPAPVSELCPDHVEVFDGRRRYSLTIEKPVPDTEFADTKCTATYSRVAGFKPKMMAKQKDFPLTLWLENLPDGNARVARAAAHTKYGDVVILYRR